MEKLTRRQQDVMDYIEEHRATHGYSPTIREIGKGLGIKSSSTVHGHVQKLIDKGHLKQYKKSPRALNPRDNVERFVVGRLKALDDDMTDIVIVDGEPFMIKRATAEDVQEWKGQ